MRIEGAVLATFLGGGAPAGRFTAYYPAWLDATVGGDIACPEHPISIAVASSPPRQRPSPPARSGSSAFPGGWTP